MPPSLTYPSPPASRCRKRFGRLLVAAPGDDHPADFLQLANATPDHRKMRSHAPTLRIQQATIPPPMSGSAQTDAPQSKVGTDWISQTTSNSYPSGVARHLGIRRRSLTTRWLRLMCRSTTPCHTLRTRDARSRARPCTLPSGTRRGCCLTGRNVVHCQNRV